MGVHRKSIITETMLRYAKSNLGELFKVDIENREKEVNERRLVT